MIESCVRCDRSNKVNQSANSCLLDTPLFVFPSTLTVHLCANKDERNKVFLFLFLFEIYLLSSLSGNIFIQLAFMASFWSFSAMLTVLMACNCSLVLASGSQQNMQVLTSAAPAILPGAPLISPAPSPDIEPLFPTPVTGGVAHSPSYSSLPTIPSSPSPPKPDDLGTPGTVLVFLPSEAPAFQDIYKPLYSISCMTLPVIYMMWLHVL
ncbi:hypothetical protein VNO77_17960 [Canavalia gladiata]|uniref:Uncharacterized protein n=1 Tax=Canavalia gladiata TaxID=3824 RepID=A0AAN9LNB2_CANGL